MKFNFLAVQESLLQQTLEQKSFLPTSRICNISDIHPNRLHHGQSRWKPKSEK